MSPNGSSRGCSIVGLCDQSLLAPVLLGRRDLEQQHHWTSIDPNFVTERDERERLEQEQREEEEREYQDRLRKLEEQERKQRARQQEIEERERRREEERRGQTEEKPKVQKSFVLV